MSIIQNIETPTIISNTETNNILSVESSTSIVEVSDDTYIIEKDTTFTVIEAAQIIQPQPQIAISNLPFIGSGVGQSKTTTGYFNNHIHEEFRIGDELFVHWIVPLNFDYTKSIIFQGFFYPVDNGTNRFSSWEINFTIENSTTLDDQIIASNLSIEDVAYEHGFGEAEIDASYFNDTEKIMHIRLKRIASSNDPTVIAVTGLAIKYYTK